MSDIVEYETTAGIATVRLNRPEVRNAMDKQLLTALVNALDRADADEDIYAVVLTGTGDVFCAGGDHHALERWRNEDRTTFDAELGQFQAAVRRLRTMGTPSIAAVNGPAVGAGCDLALACDIRFVAPEVKLIEGFVNVGLVSGDGGAWLLPRLVGEAKAKEYLLSGKPMPATEVVDLGLAVDVAEDVEAAALTFAERLRDLPSAAIQRTKLLATVTSETLDAHFERATDAQWDCLQDPEHIEMLAARRNGREPDFDRD